MINIEEFINVVGGMEPDEFYNFLSGTVSELSMEMTEVYSAVHDQAVKEGRPVREDKSIVHMLKIVDVMSIVASYLEAKAHSSTDEFFIPRTIHNMESRNRRVLSAMKNCECKSCQENQIPKR